MNKFKILAFFFFAFGLGCVKKQVPAPVNPPEPEPVSIPKIKFVFVNRVGFRSDSTTHGLNDTVFQGPCIDGKYYNKKANTSTASNTCYNRNYPPSIFSLTDSLTFDYGIYESTTGSRYGYQIELIWKYPVFPYTARVLRYTTKNYIAGDTIKIAKDTIIKFIYPNDTNSTNFVQTYRYP